MTIVVKLGGTNGSGKSSVARALIGMLMDNDMSSKANWGFIRRKQWCILGSYKNACGGMDTISDKNERLRLVRESVAPVQLVELDVVFFEGLITGKTYGAFGAMSEEPDQKGKWIYAFMDTPFTVCVERVAQRRAAAAAAKGKAVSPLDANRTMLPTFKSVTATARKAAAQGHSVVWLPHQLTPTAIAHQLVNYVDNFSLKG